MFCAFLGRWPRPSHRLSSTWRSMQFVQQVLSFKPHFTSRLWRRRRAATQRCRHGGAMLHACCLQTCGHRHRSQLLVDAFYLHSAAPSCVTASSVFLMRSPDCCKCDILFKHSFICRGESGSSTFITSYLPFPKQRLTSWPRCSQSGLFEFFPIGCFRLFVMIWWKQSSRFLHPSDGSN